MAEYIEREALKKRFCEWCNEEYEDEPCEPDDCPLRTMILDAPAADVVEVVHGEWREIDNIVIENGMLTVKGTTWRCNVCGEARKTLTKPNMNYCPNCGAKMDGERKCEDDKIHRQ